jgi:TonB-linked SusC/RagA family outer membrane protein
MGRFNYVLKDKYLLTATGRIDGSSRLAEGNKYSFFPSLALGWQLSEESFMDDVDFLDNLKLRAGYGVTGNTAISPYSTLGSLQRTVYATDDNDFAGYAPSSLANSGLGWEETEQYNFGIDFGIFRQRLSGSIDAYRQNTSDLLLPRALPAASGFGSITQNIGRTRNTGIEINLSGLLIQTKDGFNWSADVMFSKNKEEIVELYHGKEDDIGNSWFIGYPISTYYNYKFDGIWQDTPEDLALMAEFNANGSNFTPGDIRLYDKVSDKKITTDDRMILGSNVPKWIGSLNSQMNYKGFDLSFFLITRQGQMVYEYLGVNIEARELPVDVPYWTPENKSNEWPKPMAGMQTPFNMASRLYKDGSFVKLKTVTLGYTVPNKILSDINMSDLRFYILAKDPYVHHNLLSADPEAIGTNLPTVRTYMVGISASF